jgi:ribosomal protein L24E
VARSELTGRWYAVTAHAERAGGGFESMQKHAVHPADAEQLEAAHQALLAQLAPLGIKEMAEPDLVREYAADPERGKVAPTEPEAPAVEAKCRYCGEPLHRGANSLYYGPGGAAVCPQFGSGNPIATHEPEVPCRWCGEPLHLGRGNMYRDRANKSVCLGSGDRPPESVVHEPRAAVSG